MENSKNRALDGIKGISAILIACVYHLATIGFPYTGGGIFADNVIFDWIYRNGYLFVELFLCISGYITFMVYSQKIDLKVMNFPQYVGRRICRIFPLMIVTLLLSLVANLYFDYCYGTFFWPHGNDSVLTLGLGLFGIQTLFPIGQSWNYPAWSLSVFFLCWIIYFILIYHTKKSDNLRIYFCILLVFCGMTIYLNPTGYNIFLFNGDAARGYMSFFMGGLLFYFEKKVTPPYRKIVAIICFVWLLLIGILSALNVELGNLPVLFSTLVFPPFLIIVLETPVVNRFFSIKVFTFLGKISFSIYLCNFMLEILVYIVFDKVGILGKVGQLQFMIFYLVVHIIVGSIFYYIFEKVLPNRLRCIKVVI